MTKQNELKPPVSRSVTIIVLLVTVLAFCIGFIFNGIDSKSYWFGFAVMLYDILCSGFLLWMIDQHERHNRLVGSVILILYFICWAVLLFTAPVKPTFILA